MNYFKHGDLVVAKDPEAMKKIYTNWGSKYRGESDKEKLGIRFASGEEFVVLESRGQASYIINAIGETSRDNKNSLWLAGACLKLSQKNIDISNMLL